MDCWELVCGGDWNWFDTVGSNCQRWTFGPSYQTVKLFNA